MEQKIPKDWQKLIFSEMNFTILILGKVVRLQRT